MDETNYNLHISCMEEVFRSEQTCEWSQTGRDFKVYHIKHDQEGTSTSYENLTIEGMEVISLQGSAAKLLRI